MRTADMLRNYLKIALRTLRKQKTITAINVLGLAAGMAVCLLVGLLFWDQAAHDDFHPDADRIYRVTSPRANGNISSASTPAPLAPALRTGVTGVETATRMRRAARTVIHENRGYNVEGLYAEPSFFDLFGFALESGSAETALATPYTAVVTRTLARRLFGDQDPLGRHFELQNGPTVTVMGVINRSAYHSHLVFDVLLSFATLRQTQSTPRAEWRRPFNTSTYLRLESEQSRSAVAASLERLRRQHLALSDTEDLSPRDRGYRVIRLELEPLSALPFSSAGTVVEQGTLPGTMGLIPAGLALLVLLAAGFNYVNLSTARSLTRGREVGVRKTMGAHRTQVMGQFVAEAVIVALLALGLALVILETLVPAFNDLSIVQEIGIDINVDPGVQFYGMSVLFAIGIGGLAALYPAWLLSSFQPAQVLKTGAGGQTPGFQWMTPRKGLIVLQFLIAFVVIVTGTVLYRQFEHMKGGDYPFQVDRVVRIDLQESDYGPFQQEARRQAGVQDVGATSGLPVLDRGDWARVHQPERRDSLQVGWFSMDYEAIQLLELPITASDDFSEERFESGQIVLVSESTARRLGFSRPRQALGELVQFQRRPDEPRDEVRIAGVVENLPSYNERAPRLVFRYGPERFELALARAVPCQDSTALQALESTWDRVAEDPFRGSFVRSYVGERFANALAEFGSVMGLMAVLAVLISCLGLLGIVTYTVQTRTREIGIRKALGATVSSVVGLLSKDVLWLVGTAVGIGIPIAWILNRTILRNFALAIDFGPITLLLVALTVLTLAFAAVAPPTLRAARVDPAVTLRDE